MARKHQQQQHEETALPGVAADSVPSPTPNPQSPNPGSDAEAAIPLHRRCPVCWGGRRGVGLVYKTADPMCVEGIEEYPPNVKRRYYKCARTLRPNETGPCGHTWVVEVRVEVTAVEHRHVDVKNRD